MRPATNAFTTSLLIALIIMIGCSSYQPPKFEAVGVREIERSDNDAVIAFRVQATNPNRDPMELGPVTYTLSFSGDQDVFTGVRSPQSTLHTYSSHVFELPAVVPASIAGGTGEITYQLRGSVVYKNPGALADVLFDSEFIVPEATLNLSGMIDLGE